MANKQSATSIWKGTLKEGSVKLTFQRQTLPLIDFGSRFETGSTTNPEELLAGAVSSCFSMLVPYLVTKRLDPLIAFKQHRFNWMQVCHHRK